LSFNIREEVTQSIKVLRISRSIDDDRTQHGLPVQAEVQDGESRGDDCETLDVLARRRYDKSNASLVVVETASVQESGVRSTQRQVLSVRPMDFCDGEQVKVRRSEAGAGRWIEEGAFQLVKTLPTDDFARGKGAEYE